MDSLVYFAILMMSSYISEAIGLLTGFVMLLFFSTYMYQFFNQSIGR